MAPLHGILPGHGPTLQYSYVYIYSYVYDPVHLRRRHNHRNHDTAASRNRPPLHQISDASPVIGRSFAGHSFSTWYDLQFSIWLDSIGVLFD